MPLRPRQFLLPILALTIVLASSGCLHRSTPLPVVSEPLRGDLVWSGNVFIGGDVTLVAGARLTLRPGTVVRFLPPENFPEGERDHPYFTGSELNVEGDLIATGTPEAPVVFAAADDSAPPGSWGAINFAEGSRGTLRNCIFRQADSAVHSREATVEITESLFENNLIAVRFHSSNMRIEHNLLRGNGTGLRFHFGAPIVRGNRFEQNRINLFVTSHPRDYLVENNAFGAPFDYDVVLGEEVPEDVSLPNNYWEDLTSTSVPGRFFDGRRVPYLGRVQIEPVLDAKPEGTGPSWIR